MAITLYYTNIITPVEVIERGAVVISDEGKILYAGPLEDAPRAGGLQIDLRGRFVAPGFIDIHTHGGNGVTFGNSNPVEELRNYSEWVAGTGVTGYQCSLAASSPQALVEIVSGYAEAMQAGVDGAEPLGIHLEGPYLNKERKGAFNPAWLRLPALAEGRSCLESRTGLGAPDNAGSRAARRTGGRGVLPPARRGGCARAQQHRL